MIILIQDMVFPPNSAESASRGIEGKGNISPAVRDIILTAEDIHRIEGLIAELLADNPLPDERFFDNAKLAGQQLPFRIREEIYRFQRYQLYPGIRIRGFPVDDREIGPTPSKYRGDVVKATPVMREQALHAMLSSQLGEPIAWTTQQSGNFFNDIIPIRENQDRAISSGSSNLFDLHTEDAALFPHIPDYLGLMGLRNPDDVPTLISTVDWSTIDPAIIAIASQPRFLIGVNMAHQMGQPQKPTPILFGSPDFPYFRVNLNLQQAVPDDVEAAETLSVLTDILNQNISGVVVGQGDYFYLDNYRAAHGRGPYNPRYDGTDRWLQRLVSVTNLHLFQDISTSPGSRTLDPNLIRR